MQVLAQGLEVGSATSSRPWSEPEFHIIPGTNSVGRAVPETYPTRRLYLDRNPQRHGKDRGPLSLRYGRGFLNGLISELMQV